MTFLFIGRIYTTTNICAMLKLKCRWDNCQEKFETEDERFKHIKVDHITKNTTRCMWENCKYTGNARWNIISHTFIHLKIVSEICYLCNKSFKRRNEYKTHYKTHSENDKRLDRMARFLLERNDTL